MIEQQIRFCTTSDGVRIAYAVSGSGTPVVRSLGWFTHLEYELEGSLWSPFNEFLSQRYTLVRYDGRGMGLSDREVSDFSLDAKVRDLEAVIDAAGLDRCALVGISEGGPTSVAYAAQHPDRVTHLVLYGTTPDFGIWRDDASGEQFEAMLKLVQLGWGSDQPQYRQFFTGMFMPDATGDSVRLFNEFQRHSASPENVVAMLKALVRYNVRDIAPNVQTPTLVIHRRGDSVCEFEHGRQFATLIPSARFLPLEGRNHIPMPEEPEWTKVMESIDTFISGEQRPKPKRETPPASGLVTILFTDMESSTALTQKLGDERAQELVRQHNRAVREALAANGGSEIKHTGDGIMASFSSARRAIDAAIAIQRALAETDGPRVRIGLNAGEPVAEDEDLFGTAVQLAARACDQTEPGKILVSNVVRELAAGKGFLFNDSGAISLRGFEDPVRLFEVSW